jgi:carboxypeptidase family protein
VNSKTALSRTKAPRGEAGVLKLGLRWWFVSLILLILCCLPALAESKQAAQEPSTGSSSGGSSDQQLSGNIDGTVVDQTGAVVAGARITLTRSQFPKQETLSGRDGQFSFANIPPGPFQLAVTSDGFAAQTASGILHPGEVDVVPPIALAVAANITEVQVMPSQEEIAEEQVKDQEKQRVMGFIPNFYVSYVPNAVPLNSRQKFRLALKTSFDPVTFGLNGASAGIQQATNSFSGYGQGVQGYAKRYGASYADFVTGTFIGSAILPSLLKQDPRYFYKGTGSKRSRILYAIANAVICKGDNGNWQPNYSSMLGSVASAGISNSYYPAGNRGVALTFENALMETGENAAGNLLQEFLIRKLTPNLPNHQHDKS